MDRLGDKHIKFIKKCATDDKHTHLPDDIIPKDELNLMVSEGILIEYVGTPTKYAVTRQGSALAASFSLETPELKNIAIEFVKSKGYNQADAESIVKEHGAEHILKSKVAEDKLDRKGQREVTVPSNEQGKHEIKFRK